MVKNILFSCFLLRLVFSTCAFAETTRIGVLTDLSGPVAFWGKQTRIGAEIAKDEIQAKGGDVALYFGDHQLQSKTAVSEFQKLTDIDHIEALYMDFTPTAVAVAPLTKNKGIPAIYAAAAVSPLSASPYIFKTYLNYVDGCRTVGEYWRQKGLKTVGILKSSLEFGELCVKGLKQVFPNLIEVGYNPSDDIASQVLLLKSKGVEAVMNVAFEPDFVQMLQRFQNLKWQPYVGTQHDAIGEVVKLGFGVDLERTTVFSLPSLPTDFIAKVKRKDSANTMTSLEAAGLAYLHVRHLFAALVACPRRDGNCVVDKLSSSEEDSISGFNGWKNRIADFKVGLRTWRGALR